MCVIKVLYCVQILEPVFEIVLNSLELELYYVRLMDDKTGQEISISELILNVDSERVEFKFLTLLQPGQYNMQLTSTIANTSRVSADILNEHEGFLLL